MFKRAKKFCAAAWSRIVKGVCLTACVATVLVGGNVQAQSTSLTEANDAIVAAADRVENLAQTVATNTSSNAISCS